MDTRGASTVVAGRAPGELSAELLSKFAKCFGGSDIPTSPLIVQSQIAQQRQSRATSGPLLYSTKSLGSLTEASKVGSVARFQNESSAVYPEHIWSQRPKQQGKVEPFPRNAVGHSASPSHYNGKLAQMRQTMPSLSRSSSCPEGRGIFQNTQGVIGVPQTAGGATSQARQRPRVLTSLPNVSGPTSPVGGMGDKIPPPMSWAGPSSRMQVMSVPSSPMSLTASSTRVPNDQLYSMPGPTSTMRSTMPSNWRVPSSPKSPRGNFRSDSPTSIASGLTPTSATSPAIWGNAKRQNREAKGLFVTLRYPPEGSEEYPGSFGSRPYADEPMFLDGSPLHSIANSRSTSRVGSQNVSRFVSRDPSRVASRVLSRVDSPESSVPVSGVASPNRGAVSSRSSPRMSRSHSPRRLLNEDHSPTSTSFVTAVEEVAAPKQKMTLSKKSVSTGMLPPTTPKESKMMKILATQLCAKLNALRKTGMDCASGSVEAPQDPDGENKAEKAKANRQEEKFGSLLQATLGDKNDTVESITKALELMNAAMDEVCGARHATACIAERALRTMEAKLDRLTAFRTRQEKFAACCLNREELLQAVVKGADPMEIAADAMGFRRFVAHALHHCPFGLHNGKPQDADKTDFDGLMNTFGLPTAHIALKTAEKILKQGTAGWATSALRIARLLSLEVLISEEEKAERRAKRIFMKSAAKASVTEENMYEHFLAVARINLLAHKAGAMKGDEEEAVHLDALEKELKEEALALSADKLKEETDKIVAKDEDVAEECVAKPQNGGKAALAGSEQLKEFLNSALKKGVELRHDTVMRARLIITDLQAESIRRDAKAMIFTSDEEYRRKGWIEDAATKCADNVEKMVAKAIKNGIPDAHPKLTAAYMASKELREQEGFRKREYHVEKRKREKEEVARLQAAAK